MAEKKRKPGKVVRLNKKLQYVVERARLGSEAVSATIFRLIEGEAGVRGFVLPSDIFLTKAEARGEAIVRSVKRKSREVESPIEVKVQA